MPQTQRAIPLAGRASSSGRRGKQALVTASVVFTGVPIVPFLAERFRDVAEAGYDV